MIQISPETKAFIREHTTDDVRSLALQSKKYPEVDMPMAMIQISGYQIAAEKLPTWNRTEDVWYPRHLSLEQCSSEVTARYKATLVQGDTFTDLTGGFGIDCFILSQSFNITTYVERQEELCEIALHNAPLLGVKNICVRNEDAVEYLQNMQPVDCIFIDPARRNEHGGKTVVISDCEPDVSNIEELLLEKAKQVLIKLSPMLDLSLALKELKHTKEVHIVSVNNECKELLLLLEKGDYQEVSTHCINFTSKEEQQFTFTLKQEQDSICTYASDIEQYLYEPNASILKAGAFRSIASVYQLKKLHPNSHLYTSVELNRQFPGRVFRITGRCSFNKKEIKEVIGDIRKANITVRNFPASVAELRKRMKITDGGDIYLFATTLNNNQKVLIRCEKA